MCKVKNVFILIHFEGSNAEETQSSPKFVPRKVNNLL